MTARSLQYTKPLAGIAVLSLLAACSSDVTGGNRHPVQLSFTTRGSVSASTNGVAADLVIVRGDNELVLTRVQLVLRKIELDRIGTADCVGEVEDENDDQGRNGDDDQGRNGDDHQGRNGDECEEVLRDPVLIDLPVNGVLLPVIIAPLPAGTFTELEAKLKPVAALLHGNSVRVEGKFNGVTFEFTSRVRAKLEMEFDPPLEILESTKNATVAIDISKWFLTSSDAVIDPMSATPGSTNLRRIENNIRSSFRALEDDDEDGEDDRGRHHGNDDGGHH